MKKNKVFYGRVSTKKEEQDSSIINQEQYFKERGIKKGYIDRGSGTSIDKRPQFQQMLKDAGLDIKKVKSNSKYKSVVVETNKESKISYIYTKSISRFARNVRDALEICELLKRKGVYVHFEDLNKCTNDESFFVTMGIMAIMAENESREKSRSIKMGAAMSAKNGIVRSNSAYGYIYNKEEKILTAIPEEAEIVKQIFEMKANGLGGRKIANELNKLGYRTREEKEWLPNVINRMVKNPIYFGATVRNKYETNTLFNNNSRKLKDEKEWIVIKNNKVEPIISEELFNKAQEVRKKYTTDDKENGNWCGRGELSQKIMCSKCKEYYTRNRDTKKRVYGEYVRVFYNCSTKKRYGKSKCDARNVSEEEIENLINIYVGDNYKKIANNFLNNLILKKVNDTIERLKCSINADNTKEIDSNNTKIDKLKSKLKKLITLCLEDSITKDVFKEMKLDIENKIYALEKENSKLSECEDEIMSKIKAITDIVDKAKETVKEIPSSLTREEFIENHLINIIVKEKKLMLLTEIHALSVILIKIIEGVDSGEDKFSKLLRGDV